MESHNALFLIGIDLLKGLFVVAAYFYGTFLTTKPKSNSNKRFYLASIKGITVCAIASLCFGSLHSYPEIKPISYELFALTGGSCLWGILQQSSRLEKNG